MLTLAVCLTLATCAVAIEKRSYRIDGMGRYLSGVVVDQYTDLVANPARLSTTPTLLTAKAGDNANPLSLGYVAGGNWAVIGEWRGSRMRNDSDSTSLAILNGATIFSNTSANSAISNLDYPSAKVMKAFSLFGRTWGFGLEYLGQSSVSTTDTRSSFVNYGPTSVPVQIENEVSRYNSTYQSSSYNLQLGKYTRDEKGETDLIFGFNPYYSDSSLETYSSEFTDYDPDLNGLNISNNPLAGTPNTSTSVSRTASKSDPRINVGVTFEYRARRRESDTSSRTAIIGASYWNSAGRTRGSSHATNSTTVGAVVTTTLDNFYTNSQERKSESGEAYATFGRATLLMGKKLQLAYAAGLDVNVSRGVYTNYLAGAMASNTDFNDITGTLYSSAGIEYLPVTQLALRCGVTPAIDIRQRQDKVVNYNNILNKTIHTDSYAQSVSFSAGFGLRPVEQLRLDVFVTTEVFKIDDYNLMLQYLF
jgi:hypothetical protein